MLKNIKISTRLKAGFAAVLVLTLFLVVPVVNVKISDVVHEAESTELKNLYKNAISEIRSEGRLALAMSQIIATTPEIVQAMAEGRRDDLAKQTVPLFKQLKQQYHVRQFQFHLPPATSFLRAHKPQKFGDDLSSFRKTILETNQTKQPVSGLEKGVAGLGIRGINPVYYQGKHIGSVEFGLSFGQAFFDKFRKEYGVEITLNIKRDNSFTPFASTLKTDTGKKTTLLQADHLNKAMNGEEVITSMVYADTPYAIYGKSIKDFSGNPIGVLEIALDSSNYVNAIANVSNLTLFIGLIALGVGMLIAVLLSRSIVNPISRAVDAMNEIAEGDGDLTKRLTETGKDEISQLSAAFNRFAEKVREMVVQVSASTTRLATAAEQMSSITNETTEGVQKQQSETELVATAMNEMTSTVQEVALNATEASAAAQNADNQALDGKAVVQQAVSTINSLASEIETATNVILSVQTDSQKIGSILDVIRGIAEQTNLLALNAAIEAARAGEQGRGFAVVADEVRTLASRTQESTQEIQSMIESLQTGSVNAVEAMQSSKDKSQQSVEQAINAQNALEAITDSVTTISEMNIQIASAAEEQSSVSDEINKNVINISQVVEQTAQGARQNLSASNELASLAYELQDLVSQFKT